MRARDGQLVLLALVAALPAQQRAERELRICSTLVAARSPAADAPAELVAELLRAIAADVDHPATTLLVRELQRLAADADDLRGLARSVADLLATARVHPLVADALRACLHTVFEKLGRPDEAAALDDRAGHASQWLVVGPFGDAGELTSGLAFAPEFAFPELGSTLPGRFGPVSPRVVVRKPGRGTVRLQAEGSAQSGCFYGLHQVEAARATACYAEVSCRGSFELFVNGVSRRRFERVGSREGLDFRVPVALSAGLNHVLVKTDLANVSEVGVRLVDGAGKLVDGLVERAAKDGVKPFATGTDETPLPGPFVTPRATLEAAARSASGEDAKLLNLGSALAATAVGRESEALATVLALETEPPTDPARRLCLAQMLLDLEILPQEVRRDRARRLAEPILAGKEAGLHATLLRVGFLEDEDKREDAIRLLEARVAAKLAGPATFAKLLGLYRGLHFESEAEATLNAWCAAFPKSRRAIYERIRRKLDLHDGTGALGLAVALQEDAPGDDRTLGVLSRIGAEQGRAELAEAAHRLLHPTDQGDPTELRDRQQLLTRLGKTGEALAVAEQIVAHTNASPTSIVTAADDLLAADRVPTAKAGYATALARDPSLHAVRRTLSTLGDRDPFAEFAPFRRDPDALIAAFRVGEREKTASATLLLDQMLVRVYEDGSQAEETWQVKRINDVRGGEQAQTAERPANADQLVRVRTITKEGKSYVPNRVEDSFNMPRLEPGSFVEQVYRNLKGSPRPGPLRTTSFYFQSQEEPYALSEFVLVLPKNLPGALRMRAFTGIHDQKELEGDLVAHVFRMQDVPRLATEKHHPSLDDLVPLVTWGEDGDAGADTRMMRAVIQSRSMSSPIVARKAAELCAGLEGDQARAKAIHAMVHGTIPDANGPADPTSILLLAKGPRFFLEVALLREAGVPFDVAACGARNPLLEVSTAPLWTGDGDLQIPALLVRPRDGAPFWLFADTPRHAPLGFVPEDRDGAIAEFLRDGDALRTTVHATHPAVGGLAITGAMTLDKQGLGTLVVDLTLRGSEGLQAAEQVRNLEDNIQQMAGRQIAGEILKGWSLKDIDLSAVKAKGEPLRAKATLTKRGAARATGDAALLALPIPPFKFLNQLGDRLPRQLPFEWSEPMDSSWEIVLDPGDSWRCTALPEPVHRRHPLLHYDLVFLHEGDKIRMRRTVRVLPGRLEPTHFAEWVSLLRALDLAEERNLKLAAR